MPKPSEDLPSPEFHWIDIDDFHFICFSMARELMTLHEPIPDFDSANLSLLESALGNPKQGTTEGLLYPTFEEQASILFYFIL